MKDGFRYVRHPDDQGVDEILFSPEGNRPQTVPEARATAFLRLRLQERYKTSELSGNEWRFASVLDLREEPGMPWEPVSSGYSRLQTHTFALYPELYGDFREGKKHPWLYTRKVSGVAFGWKGEPVFVGHEDGEQTGLLIAAGHLAWSWVIALEQGTHHNDQLANLCAQPGCEELAVSTYRLKRRRTCVSRGCFDDNYDGKSARRFCAKHLRRGDACLEDNDANYEVVFGPGPEVGEPDPELVAPARRLDIEAAGPEDIPRAINEARRRRRDA